jgi:hypothetical protein
MYGTSDDSQQKIANNTKQMVSWKRAEKKVGRTENPQKNYGIK